MATVHEFYTGYLVPSVSIDIPGYAGVSISVQTGVSTIAVVAPFMGVPRTGVRFNLGKLIFNQIGRHAECSSSNISVGYPYLILGSWQVNLNMVRASEKYEKDIEDFSISKKLFQRHHVHIFRGSCFFWKPPVFLRVFQHLCLRMILLLH